MDDFPLILARWMIYGKYVITIFKMSETEKVFLSKKMSQIYLGQCAKYIKKIKNKKKNTGI